ncbi:16S rRNA methyltransferase [Archaeoglobus veneficus]|uniref:Ribosomal RNA small subunit methyltransferase Nep1 n=1 Tax=Archaeoglobus veneficus (strain DSM 11195 / SNP6) TaxID=693661 RepID=F2KQS3_ARCVS|nr:16S rRNA methyltransferase [Archaeoglobus veneficus]AEA46635.1 Suppressor Mra1 family protein [Archaeoglobus veneficus SNP6]
MLRLVLLEASLERVPASIARHPAVVSDARRRKKKPTEIILDDSKHHAAMKNLPNREKRGRPDIVHACLLAALDSELNQAGQLEIFIHTIGGEIIRVSGETRIPRNYNRFVGLMEDLFRKRVIEADGVRLLEILDSSLESIILQPTVLMREGGEAFRPDARTVCIGAFPHGDFDPSTLEVLERCNARQASIGNRHYTSLYVTYKVICSYEVIL